MKSRSIRLFLVTVAFLTIGPAAMAQYCKRCQVLPSPQCVNAYYVIGYPECVANDLDCTLSGDPCEPEGPMAALGSEYKVVAVERLEEPKPPATDLLGTPADTKADMH